MRKPCCDKKRNNKGAWSKQEDQKLVDYIKIHGEGCWRSLPQAAGLHRCGKSCRLRWINYLRPDIKRGNFEDDEEDLIVKLHALLGNRWSLIAGRLPGRTDNEVKNYWNSHLRKKLIKVGIDPNNHKLNQVIPRAQAADSESSRSSKSYDAKMKNEALRDGDDIEGRLSDCCRSKEAEKEEACCETSKLDLNLSIGLPSSSTHEMKSKSLNCTIRPSTTGSKLSLFIR